MSSQRIQFFVTTNTVANGSITGETFDITNYLGCSIQINVSGTSIQGSGKLQSSNDGVNWTDIGSSTQTITGSTTSLQWNIAAFYPALIRPVITSTDADTITVGGYGIAKGNF